MTSYAPNFTPRLKVHYTAGGINHTIQIRAARGTNFADMQAHVNNVRALFVPLISVIYDDFLFTAAEIALTDDDVFNPATAPTSPGTTLIDPATKSAMARIRGLTFTGKAPGSRARFTLYGIFLPTDTAGDVSGDGKITGVESSPVTTIATLATSAFHAGSGAAAVFPPVATYKENDHLLKLVRKGTIS